MQVIVTIMRGTGWIGSDKVPTRDLTTVREVCFYKLDIAPTARVKFNTCGPKCEWFEPAVCRGRGAPPPAASS
jgi:hypothetical protein